MQTAGSTLCRNLLLRSSRVSQLSKQLAQHGGLTVEYQQSRHHPAERRAGCAEPMRISPIRPNWDHVRIVLLEAFAVILCAMSVGLLMALGMAAGIKIFMRIIASSL